MDVKETLYAQKTLIEQLNGQVQFYLREAKKWHAEAGNIQRELDSWRLIMTVLILSHKNVQIEIPRKDFNRLKGLGNVRIVKKDTPNTVAFKLVDAKDYDKERTDGKLVQ